LPAATADKKAAITALSAVLPAAGSASTAALLAVEALLARAFELADMAVRLEKRNLVQYNERFINSSSRGCCSSRTKAAYAAVEAPAAVIHFASRGTNCSSSSSSSS
jgi:hypothetical protein